VMRLRDEDRAPGRGVAASILGYAEVRLPRLAG
jgi:hypothetical protein